MAWLLDRTARVGKPPPPHSCWPPPRPPRPAPVQVTGAWARATAPGQNSGAVYLTITAAAADRLLSAASPDAHAAMLHQTTHMGAMSGMADMASAPIPAGGTLAFTPGGAHIMLMGLPHALRAGSRIGLDLTFAHAGTVHVSVPVQPITAAGPPG